MTYKIVRTYMRNSLRRTVKTGYTLEQAQAHCNDPETKSRTCTTREGTQRTRRSGPWYDSYCEEVTK